jgi:hypothetical protein
VRLGRARGVERQQLKWLIYAGALAVMGLLLFIPGELRLRSQTGLLELARATLTAVGGLGIPIAVGVAILRYRLYDIDLLITQTLVYGLLTALATAVYVAIVVGIGTLVGSRGNQHVFLSIVATAALPLRSSLPANEVDGSLTGSSMASEPAHTRCSRNSHEAWREPLPTIRYCI